MLSARIAVGGGAGEILLANLGAGTLRIDLKGIVKAVLGFALQCHPAADTRDLLHNELLVEMHLTAPRQVGLNHPNDSGPQLWETLS